MIGLILLGVFCAASLVLSFLSLARAGRLLREWNEVADALIVGHNAVVRRVSELSDTLDSALDCLLTLDAKAAESSNAEVDAE